MVDCCGRKFIPAFLPKALVNQCCIRQVFWLNPISGLPACAVAVEEMVSLEARRFLQLRG
jgi:hypothetical protein